MLWKNQPIEYTVYEDFEFGLSIVDMKRPDGVVTSAVFDLGCAFIHREKSLPDSGNADNAGDMITVESAN